jgi:hypothetical protein
MTINGTSGLTFNDASVQNTAATGFGFKNRIINGAMMIDQRNAGASVNAADIYTIDRWLNAANPASRYTVQQSTVAPAGFTNSMLCTVTTPTTATSSQYFFIRQRIEGFNIADLGWGTANAQPITISFWVRSSVTGTYCVALGNSAGNRSYVATYSINAANTYEYKTVTIAGDISGTWLTNNGIGISVIFDLGSGSDFRGSTNSWTASAAFSASSQANWIGSSGATFYITGVQLEKGSTATSFDYRPYGTELALCQRYFQTYTQPPLRGILGAPQSASRMGMVLPVVMRATPTALVGALPVFDGGTTTTVSSVTTSYATSQTAEFDLTLAGSLTTYRPCIVYQTGSTTMTLSAEL